VKIARCFNSGKRFKKRKSPRRGRLNIFTFCALHLLKTIIAAFHVILKHGTKDSVVPWRGLDDLLIASPAVETAGYFHSPFGLGCFPLRAWLFSPSGGCVSDRSSPHWKRENLPPVGGISGLHIKFATAYSQARQNKSKKARP
jgi:hypothetical protein